MTSISTIEKIDPDHLHHNASAIEAGYPYIIACPYESNVELVMNVDAV